MSPTNRTGLAGVFLAAILAAANLGCGGASATPPPPLPISVSLDSSSATLFESTSQQFTASLVNDVSARGVTWTVSCSAAPCGLVTPGSTKSGVPATYTAPGAPASDLTVTLKATAVADSGKSASATIMVPALTVSVTPASATVQVAASLPVSGTVNNDAGSGSLNWTLTESGTACSPGCGTVSPTSGSGTTYTAPVTPPASNMKVTVTGTSATDATKSGTAALLVPSVGISVTPATPTVVGNQSTSLTATLVNDTSNQGVTWTISCSSAPCGNVSPLSTTSGIPTTYTAPPAPATDLQVTVTASSVANADAVANSSVIVPAIVVDVQPPSPLVIATTSQQLIATVTNDSKNGGVNWTVSCSASPCGIVSPTFSASGAPVTYTAPALPSSDLSVAVTATSATNTANFFEVTVTVPAIAVSTVTPPSGIVPITGKPQFSATVSNDPTGQGLSWTLTQNGTNCSPACGTMNPPTTASSAMSTFNGPAALPADPSVTLTAVSLTDTTKGNSASLTLTDGSVQLIPASLSFSCKLDSSISPCPPPSQAVTLTNTGATALAITSISTGASFSQTNDCGSSRNPGASCTIMVTFISKLVGSHNGNVVFNDSSADSPQQITLSGNVRLPRLAQAADAKAELVLTNSAAVPSPTGQNVVGTRVLDLVDASRKDPYAANESRRELSLRLWYPVSIHSNQGCRTANYASPKVWEYFAKLAGVSSFPVATNSCQDAAVAEGAHPVVVFSPGYTGTFTDYTFLMEDLASRGYIAVAVDHTYEATAVEFTNGRLVRSLVGSHLAGPVPRDGHSLSFAVDVRVKDMKFVLEQIARLNVRRDSPFTGKLDLSRMFVAGHSLGGLTALLMISDPHVKGAILMDPVLPDVLPSRTPKPVLMLTADRKQWAENECRLWSDLQGPRVAVSLQGTEHVALSDWIWLTKDAVQTGTMGPQKTMSAMRDYVAAFLDASLRGEPIKPLLSGPSLDYPDARVTAQQQSLCGNP